MKKDKIIKLSDESKEQLAKELKKSCIQDHHEKECEGSEKIKTLFKYTQDNNFGWDIGNLGFSDYIPLWKSRGVDKDTKEEFINLIQQSYKGFNVTDTNSWKEYGLSDIESEQNVLVVKEILNNSEEFLNYFLCKLN